MSNANKQELLIPPNGDTAIVQATPMSVLQMAVKQGANVDTLAKLLDLQERFEANEARKAFEQAFADFKKEAPKLEKTKEVSFGAGKTSYKFTPLDTIANTLGPILAKHGLSYNWKQECSKDGISVTCVLRHTQGHSIENSLGPAGADTSGSKNAIQAIGSAVSYLRRYTLLGVLGMATSDEDADGVTNLEAADFLTLIKESRTTDELKSNFTDAVKEANAKKSYKVVGMYFEARDARAKELARP